MEDQTQWTPTENDARTAAKVLRWTARHLEENEKWYSRWRYPIGALREYAVMCDELADIMAPGVEPK